MIFLQYWDQFEHYFVNENVWNNYYLMFQKLGIIFNLIKVKAGWNKKYGNL